MEDRTIELALRRPEAYWHEDGLAEIYVGLLGLMLSSAFLLEGTGRAPGGLAAYALVGLGLVGHPLGSWLLRKIKTRLVYPRTGRVTYRPLGARAWSTAVPVAAAVATAAAGALTVFASLLDDPTRPRLLGLVNAVLMSLLVLFWARAAGWPRRFLLSATAPLLGATAAAWIAPNDSIALALVCGATAATLIATGAAALAGHMRHQPQEGPAADGR